MRCSSCGAKLSEGAKFCGECGAKVVFEEDAHAVDLNKKLVDMCDIDAVLSKECIDRLVREIKQQIQKRAQLDRVLVRGDKGFDEKIDNFIAEYNARVDNDEQTGNIRKGAVAIFDYSTNGRGRRGFVFADRAVYNISNNTPDVTGGYCITGCIPWKVFFKFANSIDGKSYWQIKMSQIVASDDVDEKIKSQIKNIEHVEKLFFTSAATGLESSFMAYELAVMKNALCGKDDIAVDPLEICGIFRRLKSQLKTDRIYFKGDGPFDMKCDSLLKSAASVLEGMTVREEGFTAVDKTQRFKDDEPRVVNVDKDDYLVLLDNTKAGLFGGFDSRPCLFGCLVTKKGVLVYNCYDKKMGYESGFALWSTVAFVEPSPNSSGMTGIKFFYKLMQPYPNGPRVRFYFDHAGMQKRFADYYCEAICHLWHIIKGIPRPFDFDEYDGDPMGDAEDGDSMGEAD